MNISRLGLLACVTLASGAIAACRMNGAAARIAGGGERLGVATATTGPATTAAEPTPCASPGLVDATTVAPGLRVDLKYASSDNFLGRNVYGDLRSCLLVPDAARKLGDAARLLAKRAPELALLAYDCGRPLRVQRLMWSLVAGTPSEPYVANPNLPAASVHNRGCAVDLTLAERATGKAVPMGTAFDAFATLSEPSAELSFFEQGSLDGEAFANRLLLREVMVRAGFRPRANEWWHFDCEPAEWARERYPLIE